MYGPETFIVRVEGDAMAPRVNDGDYVFIDPDEPAVHGCVVGVRESDGRPGTVHLYTSESGRRLLRTLNPARIAHVLDAENETMILGVA
ncbi:MAG: S24 family peptidase, partial [Gammaproteobacteria bacterium]|nr:S24 family peptidase [Gammaproteobacteria bacterium]